MRRDFGHYSNVKPADWPWQSFSPREMACKGTGNLVIDTQAMDMLQRLRTNLGKPLVITSAYRSPEHNRNVGGAKRSKHMEAIAFDVRMDNHDPHTFEAAARAVGFQRFWLLSQIWLHAYRHGRGASWGQPWPSRQPHGL
jgi:zinc D-Ala-D-Ala carboxypeptidase